MIKAVISFKTIHSNIRKLRKNLGDNVKICAVVKANAYSLGIIRISCEIEPQVDCFAVAAINEAVSLRSSGITKPILLFGVCEDFSAALENGIIISINSVEEIKALSKYIKDTHYKNFCKVHIKVNCGMNRYGIANVWQLRKILGIAASTSQIQVDGLYTQLAFAMDKVPEIEKELKKFAPFRSIVRAYYPKVIIHAACSNNLKHLPAQFDMVRVGKILYGGYEGYRTAIKITSRITAIQHLKKGATVGYDGTEAAAAPATCAVVPCGYADLIHYNYSNTHNVLVGNKFCKILGRACMDTIMIDVTGIRKPLGRTVTIMNGKKGLGLMDIANSTNTIACNLLCSFHFDRCKLIYKK